MATLENVEFGWILCQQMTLICFTKFAEVFPHQNFVLYGIRTCALL